MSAIVKYVNNKLCMLCYQDKRPVEVGDIVITSSGSQMRIDDADERHVIEINRHYSDNYETIMDDFISPGVSLKLAKQ